MKIKKIKFFEHDVLGNLELDFTDPVTGAAADSVVLAGENGCGKTVILEEIYSLISEPRPGSSRKAEIQLELDQSNISDIKEKLSVRDVAIESNASLKIGFGQHNTWNNHRFHFEPHGSVQRHAADFYNTNDGKKNPFRAFFSEAGVDFTIQPVKSVTATNVDTLTNSRRGGSSLAREISQLIVDIRTSDNEDLTVWIEQNPNQIPQKDFIERRMTRFRDAINFMFPNKRLKSIARINGEHVVQFEEKGKISRLDQLSMGEKQIVFRGGFVLRDLASIHGGIVLIDEPELGLHPDWQAKIFGFYRRLLEAEQGISTQLICATHSPFIVHNNEYAKVVVLRKNGTTGAIEVEPEPKYPTSGARRLVECFNVEALIERSEHDIVVLLEGETDRTILDAAWKKMYPNVSKFFDLKPVLSHNAVRVTLNDDQVFVKNKNKKIVGIFDFDSAFDQWNGVWKKTERIGKYGVEDCLAKKHSLNNGWAFLLPVPAFRSELASEELGGASALTIELLFQDKDLLPGMTRRAPLPCAGAYKLEVVDSKKTEFAAHVQTLPKESFLAFAPIFARLIEIRDGTI
jgi:predicted ATPase